VARLPLHQGLQPGRSGCLRDCRHHASGQRQRRTDRHELGCVDGADPVVDFGLPLQLRRQARGRGQQPHPQLDRRRRLARQQPGGQGPERHRQQRRPAGSDLPRLDQRQGHRLRRRRRAGLAQPPGAGDPPLQPHPRRALRRRAGAPQLRRVLYPWCRLPRHRQLRRQPHLRRRRPVQAAVPAQLLRRPDLYRRYLPFRGRLRPRTQAQALPGKQRLLQGRRGGRHGLPGLQVQHVHHQPLHAGVDVHGRDELLRQGDLRRQQVQDLQSGQRDRRLGAAHRSPLRHRRPVSDQG